MLHVVCDSVHVVADALLERNGETRRVENRLSMGPMAKRLLGSRLYTLCPFTHPSAALYSVLLPIRQSSCAQEPRLPRH